LDPVPDSGGLQQRFAGVSYIVATPPSALVIPTLAVLRTGGEKRRWLVALNFLGPFSPAPTPHP